MLSWWWSESESLDGVLGGFEDSFINPLPTNNLYYKAVGQGFSVNCDRRGWSSINLCSQAMALKSADGRLV